MGFFKMIRNMNNSDGIREAMKLSYKKVAKTLIHSVSNELFKNAMYNALGTRYMINGKQINEMLIWIELEPFLKMENQEIALLNLCEYVVYKERPLECKFEELKRELNKVNKIAFIEDGILDIAKMYDIKWIELIE